jgi:hypothetical protein
MADQPMDLDRVYATALIGPRNPLNDLLERLGRRF